MTYTPLDQVEMYLRRYVVYPHDHALTANVLWIAHTYMMDVWDITPRMGFFSPEPGSGKSRALECSRRLAHNPMPTASITGASFMRMVHDGDYTIFIDELEGIYGSAQARDSNGTLTSVLNAGFESDAVSHRCEAKTNKPEVFNIYAPVMLAGLNRAKLPDSLKSRMIAVHMKRKLESDEVTDFRKRYAEAEAKPIREALAEWCEWAKAEINLDAIPMPDGVRDRDADVWEPLFAIAQLAGGDWPKRAAEAAVAFVSERADASADSSGMRLLRDCASLLEEAHTCEPDWLRRELCSLPDAPWGTWGKNGSGLTTFDLKRWLKDYGIKPYAVRAGGGAPVKGYHVKQFEEELARYPEARDTPVTPVTTVTSLINNINDVTDVTNVTALHRTSAKPCAACDDKGCPHCRPRDFGIGVTSSELPPIPAAFDRRRARA